MSDQYCPDCGAVCNPRANACPECKFPLELIVRSQDGGIFIDASQANRWKRVSTLLKRGGLRLRIVPSASKDLLWWSFPIMGALIFVCTLLFGHNIVDSIWEPPKGVVSMLDLNNPTASGANPNTYDTDSSESGDLDEGTESSVDFLANAFKSNADQHQRNVNQDDMDALVDKKIASLSDIQKYMEEAFLNVKVDNQRRRGALIHANGFILVDSRLLEGAFQREIVTVNEDRTIKERAIWLIPEASYPGGDSSKTTMIQDGEMVGLTLLGSDFKGDLSYDVDFNTNFNPGEVVWVAKIVGSEVYPEKVSIATVSGYGEDVNVWVLENIIGSTYSGSPVFNQYGSLAGVLMDYNGESVVMPLITVRERAPLIYKALN